MQPPPARDPFVERHAELDRIDARLRKAGEGNGGFVAVAGEAGAGKSRLIEELRRRAGGNVQFLAGRAFDATATMPYAVWVDALDAHLREMRRRDVLHVLGDSADLRRLFSAVTQQFSLQADAARIGDIGAEQTRLFGQMTALVERLADIAPVVLVLDNLQWADASSIQILHAVVRGLRGRRVLIVGMYRPEDVPRGGALQLCLDSLDALGCAETLVLAPLTVDATAEIVALGTGSRWPDAAIQRLHRLTQGNALFVREYVKHAEVRYAGRPPPDDDDAWHDGASMPETISALIRQRLRELDDDARRALSIASVIEAHIGYELLKQVTEFDDGRLLDALDKLTALRLLDEVVSGNQVGYEFHKPLVQATVYQSMGAARRQFLHRAVATALMRGPRAEPLAATRIARHVVAGSAEGKQEEALPYLLQAALDAVGVFGNHEAVSLLSTAIRIAAGSPASTVSLFELHLYLGESYKRLGRFDRAIEAWTAALAFSADRERASLRRCIARALWQMGNAAAAMRELELGLDDLGSASDSVEAMFLRQEIAQANVRQGDVASGLRIASQVLDAIDARAEPELAARAYIVSCQAHGYRGDMRAALQAGAKAVSLSETLAYPGAAFLAHYTQAALLRYGGDLGRFEAHCEACERIAAQMHAVSLQSWPLSIRVERYTGLGRFRQAMELGERAVELDRSIDQGTMLPRSLAFLAVAYRLCGDAATARKYLGEAEKPGCAFEHAELRSQVVVGSAGAYLDFLDGRYLQALERIDTLVTRIERFEPLAFYLLHPYVLPLAAEAAIRAGLVDRAAALVRAIRNLQRGVFRPAEASVKLVNGLSMFLTAQYERARGELTDAIAASEAEGRPYDAARTRIDLAGALDALGRPDEAIAELMQAGSALAAIGAARDAAMVSQRLRKRGVRPAFDVPRRAGGQAVSAREMDVVALVATGKTNREIAADLFLSELTIETHVKNILRKLGLKSRAQIAAYAAHRPPERAGPPAVSEAKILAYPGTGRARR